MFCKNCGKEINDNAVICPNCGVQIAAFEKKESKETCTLAIVGFVLSFLIPIAGLICSIIARKKCNEENLEGGGLAFAGIIISAVVMAITVLYVILMIIGVAALMA